MSIRIKWIGLIYKVATGSKKIQMILTPVAGLTPMFFRSCDKIPRQKGNV